MVIALTGFMGCGKSSVGRELSVLLRMPLVDLDKYIVDKAGKSIADIFAEQGEKAFRDLESKALAELLMGPGSSSSETSCSAGPPPSKLGSPPLMLPRVAQFPRGNFPDKNMASHNDLILSLGGGTILRPENAAMIKKHCTCIFLRATVETLKLHLGGDQSHRPLLKDGGFEAMLAERTPLYTAAADFIIDIDSISPMQTAGIIANLIT
ncbi:MAG: shikimate kinase [Bacteroidales bacterium]|nr:shikimate kinase [Bacteroidales bacterium]